MLGTSWSLCVIFRKWKWPLSQMKIANERVGHFASSFANERVGPNRKWTSLSLCVIFRKWKWRLLQIKIAIENDPFRKWKWWEDDDPSFDPYFILLGTSWFPFDPRTKTQRPLLLLRTKTKPSVLYSSMNQNAAFAASSTGWEWIYLFNKFYFILFYFCWFQHFTQLIFSWLLQRTSLIQRLYLLLK